MFDLSEWDKIYVNKLVVDCVSFFYAVRTFAEFDTLRLVERVE